MSKIKVMDTILANKIAAGEVVEKIASVVKELVENSIDAKSNVIKIELTESGTKEIKVTDNGIGMDKEDAVLAFNRHATSKIISEQDLFHISTLGFRGEALAAIASVSQVELKTSTGNVGTMVKINGGIVESVENGDARKGTVISIKNLFYNTPARLKHMKSLYSELANVSDYIMKLALSHPEIDFTLTNNNNILIKTDGSNNLLKTIHNVMGNETARKMLNIKSENDDYEIEGYISLPEIHKSNRTHMITLVNGRIIRNMDLNKTINDAYHSFKPDNRYPVIVLNIQVDPTLVDVNIHPTKMDIKFSKIEELLELTLKTIKSSLRQYNLIPTIESKQSITVEEPKVRYEYKPLKFNIEDKEEIYINSDLEANTSQTLFKETSEPIKLEIEEPVVIEETKERLPELYPVGIVHGTYIICQNETGMYMIDQHAAKERINYEFYLKKMGQPNEYSIDMLVPVTMELTTKESIILKQNIEILTNLLFKIEEFGINTYIIKSHPTWLPKGYEAQAIKMIIDIVINVDNNFSIERFNENLATMMSCKLAIKANEYITNEEVEQLLKDLRECDNPFNCPHGRPVIIHHSNYEIEKMFKRTGF